MKQQAGLSHVLWIFFNAALAAPGLFSSFTLR